MLDVGANREAATAFARFLVKHPRDARAEDAAYLQVLALQRDGAADETRRAAQSYLRLYPGGVPPRRDRNVVPADQASPMESAP